MTLGWTLIHFLWQGAIAALLLGLWLTATRSARVRYAGACGALACMTLAPVFTYLWLSQPGPTVRLGQMALALGSGDALSRAVIGAEPIRWIAWLPAVWMVGVTVLSARLILAACAVHRLSRGERLADHWPHLRARLGIRGPVAFLASTRVTGPLQAGFWKPVILLPAGLLTQLPAAHVEAIIAHELAHIARHDYLVNWWQTLMETLLFYHPAVWWVSRVMRAEREICCDEMAAAATGGVRQYAEALVNLEEMAMQGMTLTNAATGGSLRQRIARLLGQAERPARLRWPALVAALVLVGTMTLPVFESRAQSTATPSAPTQSPAVKAPVPLRATSPIKSESESLRQGAAAEAPVQAPEPFEPEVERLKQEVAELRAALAMSDARQQEAELQKQAEAVKAATVQAELAETERRQRATELAEMRQRLDRLRQTYRPTHPDYRATEAMIEQLINLEQLGQRVQAGKPTAYDRWLQEDVVYIITPEEAARFSALGSDAEREKFIEQFWARRDPTPGTEANEKKEEHYRRIAYANERFSKDQTKGWKTPRGRVYIVKGPPDEIESHPNERREKWRYRSPLEDFEFSL
ncbi:MAG: GWxTD domain-containing protein [Bryobacteraceae bacterium]|nr:GWxTD domain-containing protein [Bryobacteraceae bacterium]